MEVEHQSKMNLIRDKNVVGSPWKKTYKGYFGNKKNVDLFVKKILPFIPKKKTLNILYAASANGLIGESLIKKLNKKGNANRLTLVDISKEHLKENKNKKTRKVLQDITNLKLNETFDVILMRSSLDYFSSEKMQIKVLKNIRKHLKEDGVFFNQAASMPTIVERNLANRIYTSNKRIGRRHFQCKDDVKQIYAKAGFKKFKKIGDAPVLLIADKEHRERYNLNDQQVERIRKLINKIPKRKRPSIKLIKEGYKMRFVFPIYTSWRNKRDLY